MANPVGPVEVDSAEQRAADQAFQQLMDAALAVELSTGRTLSEWLGPLSSAELRLRQAMRAEAQLSSPRDLPGGLIEMEAWLPTLRLQGLLDKLALALLPELDRSQLRIATRHSTLTGSARAAVGPGHDSPVGWRHCDAATLAVVRRAAWVDLRLHVADQLSRWRLSARMSVGDLWQEFPRFAEACRRRIEALPAEEPILEPTGICRAGLSLTRDRAIELLVVAATECGEDLQVDLSQAVAPDFADPVRIEGYAVPPQVTRTAAD